MKKADRFQYGQQTALFNSGRLFFLLFSSMFLAACGANPPTPTYKVSALAGEGGAITADRAKVNDVPVDVRQGESTSYTVTPDTGYRIASVTGCGGSLTGNTFTTAPITADCSITASFAINTYTVNASAGTGGSISPANSSVNHGSTADLIVTPDAGYSIAKVDGCGGSLTGSTYTTGPVTTDCAVTATFSQNSYTVSTSLGAGGTITPVSAVVNYGDTTYFTVVVDTGYIVDSISGCGVSYLSNGTLNTYAYVTSAITVDCTITVSFGPNVAQTSLSYQAVKQFRFAWTDIPGASHYRLLEDPDGNSGYTQVSGDIPPGTQVYDHAVNLHQRVNARYILQTCFDAICQDSSAVMADGSAMAGAIGYFKASNTDGTDSGDRFGGGSLAISGDGNTLVVGAHEEDSPATGINPADQDTNSQFASGAVYVFARDANGGWVQQAYIKAGNAEGAGYASEAWQGDFFGYATALSNDGNTLVVGAPGEDSGTPGAGGDNSTSSAGAVYVYTRDGTSWSLQAYLKADSPERGQRFGTSVSISDDGARLAVGAPTLSGHRGSGVGRAYLFTFDGTVWSQEQAVIASNTGDFDAFGISVSLSGLGNILAVGAPAEDSNSTVIDGGTDAENDNSASDAGAAYIFVLGMGNVWEQQAYLKASNGEAGDNFGHKVALNGDGNTLVVTAPREDSAAIGVDSALQGDNSATDSGAAYVFVRDMASAVWTQQAYLKASNTQAGDEFGGTLYSPASGTSGTIGISTDGNTIVIGAPGEGGLVSGLQVDQTDDNGGDNGAAYVFIRNGANWAQQAYLKASNAGGWFGANTAISADGGSIVVGAASEGSDATGVGGDANNKNAPFSGAVYMY